MSTDVASPRPVGETLPTRLPRLARRLERLIATDRGVYMLLGAAMLVAAALILFLNRGTTYFTDELFVFGESSNLSVRELLEPVNGHLVLTSRIYFRALLEAFGADYVAFRILHVAVLMLAAGLFFALARRRIGSLPALAPTLVLLFLGSAWQHVVVPVGTGVVFAIAAGLGALLALERNDRRGDVAACALVCVSIATFSIGLAFLVGVATSVLLRSDRRSRAWIFLIPLVLYAAWWLWGLPDMSQSGADQTRASNVLLIPGWTLDSLATAAGALAGLDYDFAQQGRPVLEIGFGRVLAVAAIVAGAWRVTRGDLPSSLWTSLAIALSYWALGALAAGVFGREPSLPKFVYPGFVVLLLVATDLARGLRIPRPAVAIMFAVAAVSVATNLAILRDGAAFFREAYTGTVRTQLAMVELARERVSPTFNPFTAEPDAAPDAITLRAGPYLESVDSFGSPAYTLGEVERESASVRETADLVLADALRLRLQPAQGLDSGGECTRLEAPQPGQTLGFELAPGVTTLKAAASGSVAVELARFGDAPTVQAGELPPRAAAALTIPEDASPRPWRASIPGARSLRVCHRGLDDAEGVG